ncbi:MAG: hypothetical protein CM15mP122_0460 [Bacteroidota bacterium]|nr:MAG: hypothetical protein CM15mP122_0460 [Bacteroidota bacterium]
MHPIIKVDIIELMQGIQEFTLSLAVNLISTLGMLTVVVFLLLRTYYATVSGTTVATGGAYSGTESITFTLDTSAPTVTLTDTDSDNLVNVSQVVTITAGFSEAMTPTPTISITGIVTNVLWD